LLRFWCSVTEAADVAVDFPFYLLQRRLAEFVVAAFKFRSIIVLRFA
jgi:hypothetical protein